jgi:hypothetical protein
MLDEEWFSNLASLLFGLERHQNIGRLDVAVDRPSSTAAVEVDFQLKAGEYSSGRSPT